MYKNIKNFLGDGNSLDELIDYDLKNESVALSKFKGLSSIEMFIHYKNLGNFDCDNSNGTCSFMDSIYSLLWGWNYKERMKMNLKLGTQNSTRWNRFGPDTMNSFSTTYRLALKIYKNDFTSILNNIELQRFAKLTHTIGNMTLIPFKLKESDKMSFNQSRGVRFGEYFVFDYFDLSLKIIEENIDKETFKEFIKIFLLEDYFDEGFNINPLIRSHAEYLKDQNIDISTPSKFLPTTESELNEYLINVNSVIVKRSQQIVESLKSIL